LFPYTKKHSPYCGITGTRVFPKDHSLYPDEQGDRDYIAIVASRQKLDFRDGNTVRFSTGNSSRNAVAMVMEITK